MGSQPGGGHETPVVDWVAVWTMLIGTCALGLAMPLKSWWLGAIGGVVFVIGAGIALAYGIMNHTEDYEVRPQHVDHEAEPVEPPHAKRIISA
jgi:protein-S-isoprenylcysteine O-methyltransferase Ste14